MAHGILAELALILALAVVAAYLLRYLRVPAIAGFILAGSLVGPGGFGLVTDRQAIEGLAEVGVVLLLFGVGLKISIRDLQRLRRSIFGAGALQVGATVAVVAAGARVLGQPPAAALVWGFVAALSSTALVLTVLEERAEEASPQGRFMLGVLLFQDLAVVPMLVSLPLLQGSGDLSWREIGLLLGRSLLILAVIVAGARIILPWIMERVVASRSRELFTLTAILAALGTALLVTEFGLSMALGAFSAGLVLSESEYAQQMLAEIAPLRDAFNSLFFVSVGMLVDPQLWLDSPAAVAATFVSIVVVKGLLVLAIATISLRSWGLGLIAAAGLAHAGEFAFVVAGSALAHGVFDEPTRRLFVAVAVPTMMLAALSLSAASWLVRRRGAGPVAESGTGGGNAVVIVGFGINGRNVARVLRLVGVPYSVLEINAATVRELRQAGEPVLYADATREAVLLQAGVGAARALVVAIADAAGARQITAVARKLNPRLHIIVRTRYVVEIEALRRLGADDVVPEEFETSLELAGRVLATFGAPDSVIEREKAILRREQYGMLTDRERGGARSLAELLAGTSIQELSVREGAAAAGRSLGEIDLRRRTGASVLAVRRPGGVTTNPGPEFRFAAGDLVFLLGSAAALEAARGEF